MLAVESNRRGLTALLYALTDAHREAFGSLNGLLVGLQLAGAAAAAFTFRGLFPEER